MKTKRMFFVVLCDVACLLFDNFAGTLDKIQRNGLAGIPGCLNVGLYRYRGILERRLAYRDIRQGDIFLRAVRSDDDRVDRR